MLPKKLFIINLPVQFFYFCGLIYLYIIRNKKMHIQPININLNFQKRLVASATIQRNNKPQEVKIFHLNEPNDNEILERALNTKEWMGTYYLPDLNITFLNDFEQNKYYVMEDKKGKLLCASVVNERGKKKNKLEYIETAPRLSKYNKGERSAKFIGETMLAFIAKNGKKDKKELVIPNVAQRSETKKFYFDQCRCNPAGQRGAKMPFGVIDFFVKRNESHTKGVIEIL